MLRRRGSPHSPEFIAEVLRMRYEGKSAREVVNHLGHDYNLATGGTMTRNVVIGLWNRYGNPNKKIQRRQRTQDEVTREYEYRMERGEKVVVRKCLSCRDKVVIDRAHFICPRCKSSKDFDHGFNDYQVCLV